ncbi:MAG: zinc ribbon domain-containing protein [Candidatus Nanohaloarchaea archaeon]|nr:zinc ribbon domain-containing protein [Candidatus Nanohaloarchaea archaeon]
MKDDDAACPKCGAAETESGSARMAGGLLSSLFELETNRFDTVTCVECGYTEFYSKDRSTGQEIVDFFLG